MNKNEISLKKLRALCIKNKRSTARQSQNLAVSMNCNMSRLGFFMSEKLLEAVASLSEEEIHALHDDVIAILKKMKGADVEYKPMYKNFPKEVMDMKDAQLYYNAAMHYWSGGTFYSEGVEVGEGVKKFFPENAKLTQIGVCSEKEFMGIFSRLLGGNTSLSEYDKKVVEYFLATYSGTQLPWPKEIPFKETLCIVAADLINQDRSIEGVVSNATDVLRVMTYLSEGDVSLAANTKFKSLPKRHRRLIVNALENVISAEDVARHRNKWVRAFHNLHVGDYSKKCPEVFEVAKKIRSGEKVETFNSKVEAVLAKGRGKDAAKLLTARPGEFARRLDHVLRLSKGAHGDVTKLFESVLPKVSTRVICQLGGHFLNRENPSERVVFPKGSMTHAVALNDKLPKLAKPVIKRVQETLRNELSERAKKMSPLGKVYVEPALAGCPVPMQQRSASEGLIQVARGTRLPMSDKPTLRFFIYWVGQDIDLSATLHDENFKMVEQVSYTNLRSHKYKAAHSGDITNAPTGAAEFIDITIDDAAKVARYVVMNVFVYSGPNFSEHKECYAGWMTRRDVNANDKFDPKTVEQKIDLRSESRNAFPVIFDLKERVGIWCDLITKQSLNYYDVRSGSGNNVHTNKATIEQTLKSIVSMDNKPNLFDLFSVHAETRGELVETPEEADLVFGLQPGENAITPFDIDRISSEFLA